MTEYAATEDRIEGFLEKIKNIDVDQYDYAKVHDFLQSQSDTAETAILDLEDSISKQEKHAEDVLSDLSEDPDSDLLLTQNPLVTEGVLTDYKNIEDNFKKIFVINNKLIATKDIVISKYAKLISALVRKVQEVEEHKVHREKAEQELKKLKETRQQDRLDMEKVMERMERYQNTTMEHTNARFEAALQTMINQFLNGIETIKKEEKIEQLTPKIETQELPETEKIEEEVEEEEDEPQLEDFIDHKKLNKIRTSGEYDIGVELCDAILSGKIKTEKDGLDVLTVDKKTLDGIVTDCKTYELLSEDFEFEEKEE